MFTYDELEVEIVRKFTYLGIVFTTGGSFSETQNALAGQALKAIYKLKSYVYKFSDIKISHMLDLFDKLILPILNYGAEVWGFAESKVIERVHLQYCKHLLGVKAQTQNDFIYGELGRFPLQLCRINSIIRFWFKIIECPFEKYIKIVYNKLYENLDRYPNKKSWAKSVKNILENLGFNDVWLHQGVGNKNHFLRFF